MQIIRCVDFINENLNVVVVQSLFNEVSDFLDLGPQIIKNIFGTKSYFSFDYLTSIHICQPSDIQVSLPEELGFALDVIQPIFVIACTEYI